MQHVDVVVTVVVAVTVAVVVAAVAVAVVINVNGIKQQQTALELLKKKKQKAFS